MKKKFKKTSETLYKIQHKIGNFDLFIFGIQNLGMEMSQ